MRGWAEKVAARYRPPSEYSATIAFFEVANEPESRSFPETNQYCQDGGAVLMKNFFADVATRVRNTWNSDANGDPVPNRIAPLVSTGVMGIGQCGVSSDNESTTGNLDAFTTIHQASNIDICSVHDYDATNEAQPFWYPKLNLARTDPKANTFERRVSDCEALGKVIYIGESGVQANVTPQSKTRYPTGGDPVQQAGKWDADVTVSSTTLAQRAAFFNQKMGAALNNGYNGYLIWDKNILASSDSRNKKYDESFGVGGSDATNCVVKSFTGTACTSTNPPPDTMPWLHYGFEEDQGGWIADWGNLALAAPSPRPGGGGNALKITLQSASDKTYTGIASYVGMTDLHEGQTVSFSVYNPGTASSQLRVQPFIKDSVPEVYHASFTNILPSSGSLPAGWSTYTFQVPSIVGEDEFGAIGFQFLNEGHVAGDAYIDDITW